MSRYINCPHNHGLKLWVNASNKGNQVPITSCYNNQTLSMIATTQRGQHLNSHGNEASPLEKNKSNGVPFVEYILFESKWIKLPVTTKFDLMSPSRTQYGMVTSGHIDQIDRLDETQAISVHYVRLIMVYGFQTFFRSVDF